MQDANSFRKWLTGQSVVPVVSEGELVADPKVLELKKQQYDYIAAQINREDELVNKRLTWTLTTNGLLFAALGLYGGKSSPPPELKSFFSYSIPLTGLVISTAGLLSVLAAYIQIGHLTDEWKKLKDDRWVRPFGDKKHAYYLGGILAVTPPSMLIYVWGKLLFNWDWIWLLKHISSWIDKAV